MEFYLNTVVGLVCRVVSFTQQRDRTVFKVGSQHTSRSSHYCGVDGDYRTSLSKSCICIFAANLLDSYEVAI